MEHEEHSVDPHVADVVTEIRNRFGADGLRDLIALAQRALAETEAALAELAAYERAVEGVREQGQGTQPA